MQRGASVGVLAGLLPWMVAATPSPALTPADIEAGARFATNGLRTVIHRLASDRLRGRDNDTPESDKVQVYLVRRLNS